MIVCRRLASHWITGVSRLAILLCVLSFLTTDAAAEAKSQASPVCLESGDGYLRARLAGSIGTELDWANEGTECAGAVRPKGGLRLRFGGFDPVSGGKIVLVFGIADLKEGETARSVPVNVTVIREGTGEFYSTQGDDKCMLDDVHQQALAGPPFRTRTYRIVGRGYCTEPARAVRGKGSILISRFDFAGAVDFSSEEEANDEVLAVSLAGRK